MNGYILVNKPVGWTSFDVVAKVRSIIREATGQKKPKVGHAGTLDPFATGLLIVLVGGYTKKQDSYMKQDKVYRALVRLGATSTTGDPEGTITVHDVITKPNAQAIDAVLKERFIGDIMQIPPIYSAIKVNGKKAYELARQGKPVELKGRKITIHSAEIIHYEWPVLEIRVDVSSGTYIRTLAEDIGTVLNVGAYCTELDRVSIGTFSLSDAISVTDLNAENVRMHLKANHESS